MTARANTLAFLLLLFLPATTFAEETPQREFSFVSFDVAPFLIGKTPGPPDYVPLMRLIQKFVAPDSWETSGGKGRIIGVDGKLLVYQQPQVQLEISRFTLILKAAQATKLPGLQGRPLIPFGNVGIDPFPNSPKEKGKPYPLIYPIRDLPSKLPFATDRDPVGAALEERPLIELLSSVALVDSTPDQAGRWILELPASECVILVQTEPEHRALVEFLTALRTSRLELGLFPPAKRRIVEYTLFDSEGNELPRANIEWVAIRLQTELKELDWDAADHFAIADKELTISQTDAAHRAIYKKLIEWRIAPLTYPKLFPTPEERQQRSE